MKEINIRTTTETPSFFHCLYVETSLFPYSISTLIRSENFVFRFFHLRYLNNEELNFIHSLLLMVADQIRFFFVSKIRKKKTQKVKTDFTDLRGLLLRIIGKLHIRRYIMTSDEVGNNSPASGVS